jgi:hypothetical protein
MNIKAEECLRVEGRTFAYVIIIHSSMYTKKSKVIPIQAVEAHRVARG